MQAADAPGTNDGAIGKGGLNIKGWLVGLASPARYLPDGGDL